MKVLITGGCKNGKSGYAQELSCALSPAGSRYYVATMIPSDDEDSARIRRHREDRAGLGFTTIEMGRVPALPDEVLPGIDTSDSEARRVFMVDSLTALLGNEMFHDGITDPSGEERISLWLDRLLSACDHTAQDHVILIADDLFSDAGRFGKETESYRSSLGRLMQFAAGKCDTVIEMRTGIPYFLKGGSGVMKHSTCGSPTPEHKDLAAAYKSSDPVRRSGYVLLIGGAAQGKLTYAREYYGLTDDDIFVCTEESAPDFEKRCICHLEKYVLYCMRNGLTPRTEFAEGTVLIADDIFCGIVPMEKETRLYREAAARYLTCLVSRAVDVRRIVCGLCM